MSCWEITIIKYFFDSLNDQIIWIMIDCKRSDLLLPSFNQPQHTIPNVGELPWFILMLFFKILTGKYSLK